MIEITGLLPRPDRVGQGIEVPMTCRNGQVTTYLLRPLPYGEDQYCISIHHRDGGYCVHITDRPFAWQWAVQYALRWIEVHSREL